MDTIFMIALGLTNAAALASWARQWRGLISSVGVTPVAQEYSFIEPRPNDDMLLVEKIMAGWRNYRKVPTLLCFFGTSDTAMMSLFVLGFIASTMLMGGILPSLAAFICGVTYLSFVVVSGPFLGLQMDGNLVETNILFAATYAFSGYSPSAWVIAQRWLVFRVMVGCAAGKWGGGDLSWRGDLKAMSYHYETQPLPNGMSRFMHFLPTSMHRFEGIATYVVEGLVPLLYFVNSPVLRWFSFLVTVGFNAAIGLTGNYGHLHMLTITEALSVLAEIDCTKCSSALRWDCIPCVAPETRLHGGLVQRMLGPAYGTHLPELQLPLLFQPVHTWMGCILAWAVVLSYICLSLHPLLSAFRGIVEVKEEVPFYTTLRHWSQKLTKCRLCNYYSKFSHMTTDRWELQMQVSPDRGQTWYDCWYAAKPGGDTTSLNHSPPFLSPGYIPRLDWRMWFLPLSLQRALVRGIDMSEYPVEPWFRRLCSLICAHVPEVVALIRLPADVPMESITSVRTLVYAYRFTPPTAAPKALFDDTREKAEAVSDAPRPRKRDVSTDRLNDVLKRRSAPPEGNEPAGESWAVGTVWKRKLVGEWFTVHARPPSIIPG